KQALHTQTGHLFFGLASIGQATSLRTGKFNFYCSVRPGEYACKHSSGHDGSVMTDGYSWCFFINISRSVFISFRI
ncbi:MAG: hypothetical protein R3240_10065, partial [Gammaproteobacteria bacterium]|nr:hypothetical protein [Gammaproteobacteria bacterium]